MAKDNKSKSEKKDLAEPVDSELQNIIEAALYASDEPLGIRKIMALFPDDAQPSKVDIQNVLLRLEEQCKTRGVELRRIGKGWRFQTKEKYATWLRKLSAKRPPRYSRALLETLSIIAYRQPVTRSDIEQVRGVGVSSDTIHTLEERQWVQQIGHRDVPGRPALFGTTQAFLEYFNMASLRELPELMDKRDLGDIAKEMNLTLPMDGVQSEAEAAERNELSGELSALGEDSPTETNESSTVSNEPSTENKEPSTENKEPSAENKESSTDNKESSAEIIELRPDAKDQPELEGQDSVNEPPANE